MNIESCIENSLTKIFFIGYNNTGTTSLSNFFHKNNMNNELDSPLQANIQKLFLIIIKRSFLRKNGINADMKYTQNIISFL